MNEREQQFFNEVRKKIMAADAEWLRERFYCAEVRDSFDCVKNEKKREIRCQGDATEELEFICTPENLSGVYGGNVFYELVEGDMRIVISKQKEVKS